jgi:phage I-like protein
MSDTVTITLDIAASPESGPPTELRIFPKGKFKTKKGTFTFDEKSAETVMAEYAEHGADKHFDYWHDSVNPNMPGHARLAAAWHKLEVRDGELWATDIRWTPPALEQVRNKQFRYLSPAFSVERGEAARVVELVSTSLVNLPATQNLRPLVAASADYPAESMPMANTIAVALGMNPDAPESEVIQRLSRDREVTTEIVKLSGKDSLREALGVVLSWKAAAEQVEAVRAEVATLSAERDAREMAEAIETAVKQGRLVPAERDATLEMGRKFGKDVLLASLATRQKVVTLQASTGQSDVTAQPSTSALGIVVPPKSVLMKLGMTAEQYIETEKELIEAGRLKAQGVLRHGCTYRRARDGGHGPPRL